LLYLAAAKVGLMYAVVGSTVSLVWAPSGIALAALLVFGWRMAIGVALGAFLANVGTGIPLLAACSIALGNTLGAVVGAMLLFQLLRRAGDARSGLSALCAVLTSRLHSPAGRPGTGRR
jgi:two-component system, NarL family, sensor histidine kinase FusK